MLVSGFLGLLVDGMDLMFLSYSLPGIMQDFGLSKIEAGSLASYTLLGMAIGGTLGGWAADRYGRVRVVVWTILLFSLGSAGLAFTQSYWQFAALRFVSALGLGAEYVVCNTLMAEYVPTGRRTTILGTLQAGWSLGYVVAAVLARTIIPEWGWRPLFLVALVPVLLALYIRQRVPEPASWRRSSRVIAPERDGSRWSAIAGNPSTRRTFLLWTLTSCCLQFGYYGVNNWLPTYLVSELRMNFTSMTGYLVGTYLTMILGKIAAGYAADVFGRRWIFVCGGLATALFLPVVVLHHSPSNIVWLLTIFGFLYGVPYGVNATYLTESFPTEVRGTAVGMAYNLGRAGAAVSPALIGVLATQHSIGLGIMTMGAAYLFAGLIPALFIPEKMYDPQESPAAPEKSSPA